MAAVSVRAATAADAAVVAELQRSTWRTAYAELLAEHAFAALDGPEPARAWADTIADEAAVVLLAVEGDWVVGFGVGGAAPTTDIALPDGPQPPDAASTALVATLLVEPRWGRRGHGGRLLDALLGELRARGARKAITWVPDADSASLAFYRKAGWDADGIVRTLDTGASPLREIRLSAALG